jgi:hypothetical protein
MKIMSEPFSVFSDTGSREIHLVLAGLKLTFTEDEARALAGELEKGATRLAAPERPAMGVAPLRPATAGAKPEEAKPGMPDVDSIVGKMRLA